MNWIVVVDDDKSNLITAGRILSEHDMRVTALRSGKALLDFVSGNKPDLILLDIRMPEMDGFETMERLKAVTKDDEIPVIFLTGNESPESETKGLSLGAMDFIKKPFDPDVLVTRVINTLKTSGRLRKFEEEATIDKLTGFLNKHASNEQIGEMCRSKSGMLMIADLDSFKLVNDIYGHDMGDRVLVSFARILKDNMPNPAVFGRIGGDEFLVFAEHMKEEKDIALYAENVNRDIVADARRMMGENMNIPLGVSMGAVFVPEQGNDLSELFKLSDKALYAIKKNGKHGCSVFRDEDKADDAPSDISLAMMSTILEERGIPQNAMWMGKEAFTNVYRYMLRFMERYSGTAYKVLFTARFLKEDTSGSEREKIMDCARKIIQESLRSSDIMMQVDSSHFFLLLPQIIDDNVESVTDRVMLAWKNSEYSDLAELTVESESIASV